MTEAVDGVLITDGQNRIFLHPPEQYPDGHGFHHQVDLVGGPFRGTIEVSSFEGPRALHSFHEQLVALYESLGGKAELPNSYDTIKVSLQGDGLGHVTVAADVLAGSYPDVRLSFTFSIDQTHLPRIIATVERLFLKSTPVGDETALG